MSSTAISLEVLKDWKLYSTLEYNILAHFPLFVVTETIQTHKQAQKEKRREGRQGQVTV
jgi:hypothetical protein